MANGGKIYLLSGEKKLIEMNESIYESEEVLQNFLASYPDLLAGEQIRSDAPLKWLLIKREIGIPGAQAEGDRWSLDHLFVDQAGVPTFVECKRSSDTRIRREVVGQMLDYAANAVTYWPLDKLRQSAAETNQDLDQRILSLLDTSEEEDQDSAIEEFWKTVEENLNEGRLRLLFISDQIPSELRRVIEFLNDQMSRTEVFAIEVKQYSDGNITALVPRVLGSTTREKGPTPRRSIPWTEPEFLQNLRSREIEENRVKGIEKLLKEAKKLQEDKLVTLSWGRGKESGSFTIKKQGNSFLSISSSAYIWLNMGGWQTLPSDIRVQLAEDLGNKLKFDLKYAERLYPNIAENVFSVKDGVSKLVEWLEYAIQITESNAEDIH
jgi:hypothetical protein